MFMVRMVVHFNRVGKVTLRETVPFDFRNPTTKGPLRAYLLRIIKMTIKSTARSGDKVSRAMVHLVVLSLIGVKGHATFVVFERIVTLANVIASKYVDWRNSLRAKKINLLEGDSLPLIRSGRALGLVIQKEALNLQYFYCFPMRRAGPLPLLNRKS